MIYTFFRLDVFFATCVCVSVRFFFLPLCVMKIVIARIARETCVSAALIQDFSNPTHTDAHTGMLNTLFGCCSLLLSKNKKSERQRERAKINMYTYTSHTQYTQRLARNIERAIYHGDIQHFSYGSLYAALFQSVQWQKKKLFRALNKIQIKTKTDIEARNST